MGIDRKFAVLLMEEARRRTFSGAVLQLGKQDLTVTWPQLRKLAKRLEFSSAFQPPGDDQLVSDVDFFKWLGFDRVMSLDGSAFEGADVVLDMNAKVLPDDLNQAFDVVFDGGTMEHVFDTPQFLRNAAAMLKVGGRVIHLSPTFNHVNHGFYAYSPTLFLDYYRANEFDLHTVLLVKHSLNGAFSCNCLDPQVFARTSKLTGFSGAYYSWTVAEKTRHPARM